MRTRNILVASATGAGVVGTALGIGAVIAARKLWKQAWAREDLQRQVAVITGGSRGLGFAMAQELASRGARLVIAAREEAPLREAEQKLRARGA